MFLWVTHILASFFVFYLLNNIWSNYTFFMKKSISTFLKHPTKDSSNRSANPPVTRASTILFNTMQELHRHEKKLNKTKELVIIVMADMGVRQL